MDCHACRSNEWLCGEHKRRLLSAMGRAQNVRYAVLSLDRDSLPISLLSQLFVSVVLLLRNALYGIPNCDDFVS